MTDSRGRQVLHVSFEGVVTENVYDGYGRLSHVNYYTDQAALAAETISERWSYVYDSHGRKSAAIHSLNSGGTFTPDRVKETFYDDRGRVIAEVGPEGVVGYGYDSSGRMKHTAVYNSETDYGTGTVDRFTHYDYDLLGRLVSVKEDATPANLSDDVNRTETDYTFDLAGRMDTQKAAAGSQSVTTDYDYDALGRLDLQTDTDESGNTLARYDYEVRADGKRTSLTESFWLTDDDNDGTVDATDGDGIQQEDELDTTTYDWTYDSVGRLTDEAIIHFDSGISQAESFEYDLTGNRTKLERDADFDSVVDEVITYQYDANDRLTFEWLDSDNDTVIDQTTEYGYDHTQQTSKTIFGGFVDETTPQGSYPATTSRQLFAYNLQGRMSSVVNEGYTSGTLNSRERTSYEYDSKSFRVSLVNETDSNLDNTFTETSRTEFLADHHNHTGYTQTIREAKANADGTTKTIDYTFGHDEIAQRVVERDASGDVVSDNTHVFGHDGHDSVRVLYDLANTADRIAQAFTFAAYGEMLAVHGSDGVAVPATAALTSLGYSGEHFDAKIQQQYLRARWYNPASGRFNRLDPFAGNMQDPQSLHKYAYVHGDPIGGIDPTGELLGTVGGMVLGGYLRGLRGVALGAAIGLAADFAGDFAVYATWRFGFVSSSDLNLNWGSQAGTLNHTLHAMRVTFPAGTDMDAKLDEIYTDLKTFRHFNSGHNTIARVRRKSIDGKMYAFFDTIDPSLGLQSDIINPGEVPVRLSSDMSDRTVVADTAGWHMLVGQRRWSVRRTGGTTVEIKTESYDYPRDQLNRFGMWKQGGDFQLIVWSQYFQNMQDHYVESYGATIDADMPLHEYLPGQESPWTPLEPYPGIETP